MASTPTPTSPVRSTCTSSLDLLPNPWDIVEAKLHLILADVKSSTDSLPATSPAQDTNAPSSPNQPQIDAEGPGKQSSTQDPGSLVWEVWRTVAQFAGEVIYDCPFRSKPMEVLGSLSKLGEGVEHWERASAPYSYFATFNQGGVIDWYRTGQAEHCKDLPGGGLQVDAATPRALLWLEMWARDR